MQVDIKHLSIFGVSLKMSIAIFGIKKIPTNLLEQAFAGSSGRHLCTCTELSHAPSSSRATAGCKRKPLQTTNSSDIRANLGLSFAKVTIVPIITK